MPAAIPWKETSQYKRLTFTVNLGDIDNFEDYDLKSLTIELKSSFFIAGRETGAEGRKHFQGYMEFAKKRYGKAIEKAFRKTFPLPLSVHFEVPYSTAEKNIAYCSKEDHEPYSKGEPAKENKVSNSLVAAMELVKDGADMLTVAEQYPTAWAQYRRSLDTYQGMLAPKRCAPTQAIFLWGPTGTGKTMHAYELAPTAVKWTGQFLNGFRGPEETLLFDDFDYKQMDWQTFLTILDRYPLVINIKGNYANFAPKTLIFTSNSNPKDWYPDVPAATREAIHRRMDEFGEIRFLGTLVPKEQNILTKFLIKKPRVGETQVPEVPPSVRRELPREDPEDIIIVESDSEDDIPLKRSKTHNFEFLSKRIEEAFCSPSPIVSRKGLFQPDALDD